MDFKQLATNRYSCRRISDREVDEATIRELLEIQRLAPTGKNAQSQRIYVLKGEEAADLIAGTTPYNFGARLFFVVCYDEDVCASNQFDGTKSGILDAAIAACHIDFAVTEAGLGTCWIGDFNREKMRQVLDLPDHHIPVVLFPIGYPTEKAKPSRLHYDRKPLDHTVIRIS